MRQLALRTIAATIFATAALSVAACHHPGHSRYEGPGEHVGKNLDHAADRTGDAVEGAGRKVNRALPGD